MKQIVLHGVRAAIRIKEEAGRMRILLASLLVFSFPACTNHGVKISRGPSSTFSQVSTSQSTGDFSLIQMSPDPISPGSIYALIGQNQEFEQYCNSGASTCECEFSYQQPGVGAQIVNVPPTYVESDMLRCPNQVPSGIVSFDVRIRALPSQPGGAVYHSNSLAYNLGSGQNANLNSAVYLDLTDPNSFMPVQRYQCRKREFIANPLHDKIADPFQSNDPRVLYPFNYYTTNVSESLLQMQRGNAPASGAGSGGVTSSGDQSWECTLNATPDSNLHWWANPAVYSRSSCNNDFCSADGELIYPTESLSSGPVPALSSSSSNTAKRRSSFSLAKRAYGVFQIPVIAAIAPRDYLSAIYSTPTTPLGWAAATIPTQSGSSACPNIPLPEGARWVKLWNFRAQNILPSSRVTNSVSASDWAIGCRPKRSFQSCIRTGEEVSPYNQNFIRTNPTGWLPHDELLPVGSLSSRVLMPTTGSPAAAACFVHEMSNFVNSTSDTWIMSRHKFNNQTFIDDMKVYGWGVYSGNSQLNKCPVSGGNPGVEEWMINGVATAASCGVADVPLVNPTPSDPQTKLLIDRLSPQSYTDHLFVVTEAEVSDSSMIANAPSEYVPVTYRAKAACMSGGSASTTRSGCPFGQDFQATEIQWSNSRIEVNAISITAPPVYPLCVVQFTQ